MIAFISIIFSCGLPYHYQPEYRAYQAQHIGPTKPSTLGLPSPAHWAYQAQHMGPTKPSTWGLPNQHMGRIKPHLWGLSSPTYGDYQAKHMRRIEAQRYAETPRYGAHRAQHMGTTEPNIWGLLSPTTVNILPGLSVGSLGRD